MQSITNRAISPAVGTVLLVGIVVALATITGIVLFDIDGLNQTAQAGVTVEETTSGVEVTWSDSGTAEEIVVTAADEEYQLNSVNGSIKLGMRKGSDISVIGKTDDSSTVLKQMTTEYTSGNNSVTSFSPGSTTRISGTVSINPPIEGATVRIIKNNTVISTATTDASGSYSINAVEESKLEVIVQDFTHPELTYDFYGSTIKDIGTTLGTEKSITFDTANTQEVQVNGETVSILNDSYNGMKTISSIHQLQGILADPSSEYILLNDINGSVTETWNNGSGFNPIGSDEEPFTGGIHGNGHQVENVFIDRPDEDYIGLVGVLGSGGIVENITVNSTVTGNRYTGGIVGESRSATVQNVLVKSSVTGNDYTGGLAGSTIGSGEIVDTESESTVAGKSYVGGLVGDTTTPISNSKASGVVTASGDVLNFAGGIAGFSDGIIAKSFSTTTVETPSTSNVGGLVGYANDEVIQSYSTGNVTGGSTTGGLIGYLDSEVSKSYAIGETIGTDNVGGLIGYNRGAIANSYANGSVTGEGYVGGFIGLNKSGDVQNTYSSGQVTARSADAEFVNGFSGLNSESINSSYWDTVSSGRSTTSGSAVGLTTTEMKGNNATENLNGFNFTDVWQINSNGYPTLRMD